MPIRPWSSSTSTELTRFSRISRAASRKLIAAGAKTGYPRKGDPYDVSLIDIDEGFRMMSRVENVDPMKVTIGLRVKVRMIPATEKEPPYPVFDPVEAA
jgi:uncharacterized OB-fold protein